MKYLSIILLLAIPGVVYAEEATIQVPFDYHGQSCTFNEIAIEYHCIWQGTYDTFTIQDLEEYKHLLSEETYEEELARLTYVEPIVIPYLTDDEKTIQKLELKLENGIIKTPDATLLQMLRTLDECQQGLGNSSAIQTERTFVISEYAFWDVLNVPVEGQLGVIAKAMQECIAQQTLENNVLTIAYTNKHNGNEDITFDHYKAFEGISAIPYEQYTKSDFTVDIRGICASNAHHQQYKEQMGCPPVQYEGFTYPEGNGFISYHSPILEEYTFFMQDYGNKQASEKDKLIQANLAEPIAREIIESSILYQNHKE